jgi:hypothetical protein
VSHKKKGNPENGGTYGEVIVKVAGGSAKFGTGPALFVETRRAEAFVSVPVVFSEIEIVLEERSPRKSVIAHTVAAHPGIEERKREKKKEQQEAFGLSRAKKD